MTKAEQARIVAWSLRILQQAVGEPRQVARTCRYCSGIGSAPIYRSCWLGRNIEVPDL